MSRTGFNSVTSSSSLRSSSFGLVGITNITPRTLRTREWSLENVPSTSPIDGKLQLKIQSHTESLIEERGFLTIFEDVGGYGAWHRKWCLLSNDQMLFWKYPDEEKIKVRLTEYHCRKSLINPRFFFILGAAIYYQSKKMYYGVC